jgi:hypothetical protein
LAGGSLRGLRKASETAAQPLKGRLISGIAKQLAEKVVEGARSRPQALKRGHIFNDLTARLNGLRKKYLSRRSVTSAAKAGTENKLVVAAVNRCATQNQVQPLLFPQAVKSCPSQNPSESEFFRKL